MFFNFVGENLLRADLSVSVPEMGSLMEHTGLVGEVFVFLIIFSHFLFLVFTSFLVGNCS